MPLRFTISTLSLCMLFLSACGKQDSSYLNDALNGSKTETGYNAGVVANAITKISKAGVRASLSYEGPFPKGSYVRVSWDVPYSIPCRIEGSSGGVPSSRITASSSGSVLLGPLNVSQKLYVACGLDNIEFDLPVYSLTAIREMQVPPGSGTAMQIFTYTQGGYVYKIGTSSANGNGYYNSISATDPNAQWAGWKLLPGQTGYTDRAFMVAVKGNKIGITAYSVPHKDLFTLDCVLKKGALQCGAWQ